MNPYRRNSITRIVTAIPHFDDDSLAMLADYLEARINQNDHDGPALRLAECDMRHSGTEPKKNERESPQRPDSGGAA